MQNFSRNLIFIAIICYVTKMIPFHIMHLFNFRFVSILPTIHLSAIITPEEAIQSRHPNDIEMLKKQQNSVESGWEEYLPGIKSGDTEGSNSQYLSEREFFITVCLVLLSFILIFYFIITRCSGR